MEIMTELNLSEHIYQKTEDLNFFRYYRYMKRLLSNDPGDTFAVHDHFFPSIEQKLIEINQYAYSKFVHLPQNKFVDILHEQLHSDPNILLGTEITNIENNDNHVLINTRNTLTQKCRTYQSEFLIACDGFHSPIRKKMGVRMLGNPNLQSFLNIHFHSQKLSQEIDRNGQNAMLHFIYNSDIAACLVNHSKNEGSFVLQVPVYPPYTNHTP